MLTPSWLYCGGGAIVLAALGESARVLLNNFVLRSATCPLQCTGSVPGRWPGCKRGNSTAGGHHCRYGINLTFDLMLAAHSDRTLQTSLP